MKSNRSKGNKSGGGASKKRVTISNKATVIKKEDEKELVDLDDEDGGFGGWLKSGQGIEWMRFFVISNSIVVFLTMTWPHLKKTLGILYDIVYGDEE